jgi:hypothetical protein
MSTKTIQNHEVADHAYRLWEKAGRPHGRDLEFWVQAEAELRRTANGERARLDVAAAGSALSGAPTNRPEAKHTRELQPRTSQTAQSLTRKGTSRAR